MYYLNNFLFSGWNSLDLARRNTRFINGQCDFVGKSLPFNIPDKLAKTTTLSFSLNFINKINILLLLDFKYANEHYYLKL